MDDRTSIAAGIGPALHSVVDETLERVAALQNDAVREARDQAQEEYRRERQAFQKQLDRLSRHADELNQLSNLASGIARSLHQELDQINAAIAKLTSGSNSPDIPDAPRNEAPSDNPVGEPAAHHDDEPEAESPQSIVVVHSERRKGLVERLLGR